MKYLLHDAQSVEPEGRVDYWRRVNLGYFGKLEVEALATVPLDARMKVFWPEPLRLFQITAPAHRVARRSSSGHYPSDDAFKLLLQVSGQSELRQRHAGAVLQPGQWRMYDPRVPYSVTNRSRCELLVLQVPREELREFRAPSLHGGPAGSDEPAPVDHVLGSLLQAAGLRLESMGPQAIAGVVQALLALLAASLAGQAANGVAVAARLPEVLRARVKHYIRSRLNDTDLSIARMAADLRCSKRYLHRIFENEAHTLESYIRHHRLVQARQLLPTLLARGGSVEQAAYRVGFKSSSHFSRVFREACGLSPREWVRQHAAAAAHAGGDARLHAPAASPVRPEND